MSERKRLSIRDLTKLVPNSPDVTKVTAKVSIENLSDIECEVSALRLYNIDNSTYFEEGVGITCKINLYNCPARMEVTSTFSDLDGDMVLSDKNGKVIKTIKLSEELK